MVSPSVTRTTGPGNCPLKVQALYLVPCPSITTSVSIAVIATFTVFAWLVSGQAVTQNTTRIRRRGKRKVVRFCQFIWSSSPPDLRTVHPLELEWSVALLASPFEQEIS